MEHYKIQKFIVTYNKGMMGKEIITFGNIEIEKRKFHHRQNLILLEDLDLDNCRYLVWFLLVKNITNILLVTKMIMIIKSNHYG